MVKILGHKIYYLSEECQEKIGRKFEERKSFLWIVLRIYLLKSKDRMLYLHFVVKFALL